MPRQITGQVARGGARITFRTNLSMQTLPGNHSATGCNLSATDDRLRLFFRDLQTISGTARLK